MKLTFWETVGAVVVGITKGVVRATGKKAGFICRITEAAIEPHLHKINLKKPIGRVPKLGVSRLRPWSFKDGVTEEMMDDPKVVLVRKIRGIGCELDVDKDGRVKKLVSMRGQKVDLRNGVPELRDKTFPQSVRNARIYVEIRANGGEAFTNGLLHSSKENADITVAKEGHPEVFVLAVHKLDGHDTSQLPFDEMRGLCELVAKEVPHGKVPEIAVTPETKRSMKDAVWTENEADTEAECDGVVAMSKDVPNKGAKLHRDKPTKSWDLVIMGFEDSEADDPKFGKGKGVASLLVGDGLKVIGKVAVASPDLKVAIKQNESRWLNKVVTVVGERMTKAGSIAKPRLQPQTEEVPDLNPDNYYVRWDKDPKDVKPIDVNAEFRKMVAGMEPEPAKRSEAALVTK